MNITWFKTNNKSKVKKFILPIKEDELSDEEKINAFIDDFNENIKINRMYLSTDFSKAACNINESLFARLKDIAYISGYCLSKSFGQYKTVIIYKIELIKNK